MAKHRAYKLVYSMIGSVASFDGREEAHDTIYSIGCRDRFAHFPPMAAIIKYLISGVSQVIFRNWSSLARDFVQACVQVDANARPTAAKLLDVRATPARGAREQQSTHKFIALLLRSTRS